MSHPDFEELRVDLARELDERAEQEDAFWQSQRHAIQRRLRAESRPVSKQRPLWALAGLGTAAAGALVAPVLLFSPILAPDSLVSPADPDAAISAEIDPETAALLRSVESTLSSDVASPLSAADVLLAEMEAEFALLQTQQSPD